VGFDYGGWPKSRKGITFFEEPKIVYWTKENYVALSPHPINERLPFIQEVFSKQVRLIFTVSCLFSFTMFNS